MLTITAPIGIKVKTQYIKDPEAFYNRIVGNYSLMETRIEQEDLLHIAATPPEIYVSEGEGMTSILARNEMNETNINKVNILNNVMNRIVASADMNLTYQDRVFITDALYRLGIRDEKRFMNAFYRMSEETKNTNTLINLYLERGGELRELTESLEKREKQLTTREEVTSGTERENFLYNRIIDRLQTGPIYEIVSNFNRSVDNNEIDAREYSIANQTYTSQHILLSRLRERAGVGTAEITFLSGDTYEENIDNEETNISSVRNEVTAAVFMDMLRNIYHTGFEKFIANNNTYYRFEDTFFKSSDQTFQRLVSNTQNAYSTNVATEEYITENNRLTSSEIELLETEKSGGISEEEAQRITETINAMNIQNEKRRIKYVQAMQEISRRESREKEPDIGMKETREDAALALTDPQKMLERIQERTEKRTRKQTDIIRELQNIFPERATEIYQLISDYKAGDVNVLQQNLVRNADIGELIYDIKTVEDEAKELQKERTTRSESPVQAPPERLPGGGDTTSIIQNIRQGEVLNRNQNNVYNNITDALIHAGDVSDNPFEESTQAERTKDAEGERILNEIKRARQEAEQQRLSSTPGDTYNTYQGNTYNLSESKLVHPEDREAAPEEQPGFQKAPERAIDTQEVLVHPDSGPDSIYEERIVTDRARDPEEQRILSEIKRAREEAGEQRKISEAGDIYNSYEENIYKAPEGELIHAAPERAGSEEAAVRERIIRRDPEAQRFLDEIKNARQSEASAVSRSGDRRGPVETIHRQTQTLTTEELNEQLEMMEHNISRQLKKQVKSDVITENHVTNATEIRSNETQSRQLRTRDIEQMIENGIKSSMNSISNQVMTKIERQMRNEKMRRGY